MAIKVGIIEDDNIVRLGYEKYFNAMDNFELVFSAGDMESFISFCKQKPSIEIILSDIGLPGMSGIQGIPIIKKLLPEAEIIMLTVFEDEERVFKALCAGATGYLLKNTSLSFIGEKLIKMKNGEVAMSPSIARKVIEYFHPKKKTELLTPKEEQIVQALVDGLSYKMIADRLQVSIHTVNSHIKNIYRKLHVHSKAEVVAKSLKGEI